MPPQLAQVDAAHIQQVEVARIEFQPLRAKRLALVVAARRVELDGQGAIDRHRARRRLGDSGDEVLDGLVAPTAVQGRLCCRQPIAHAFRSPHQ